MPRFTNKEGLVIETAVPREAAELRRDGFTEHKARTADVREADAANADAAAAAGDTAKKSTK